MGTDAAPVTIEDIDALLSGATPQFALQLKPRLWAMLQNVPAHSDVREYGEQQLLLLDRIALGTTRGTRGPGRPPADDPGWREIPSHP
jgi:hypothetical protein